jgi:hypothetical protein
MEDNLKKRKEYKEDDLKKNEKKEDKPKKMKMKGNPILIFFKLELRAQ